MAREPTGAPTPLPPHGTAETAHLRPHAPVSERVLAPGDPGRALRLAQALTREPRMLNHHRGLWGYTGTAADGAPLTVQATGLGGPSTAAVVEDLARLGARRLVRAGTCRALDGGLRAGDLVAAERVLALDGTSRALGAGEELEPDAPLLAALPAAAARGTVATADLLELPRACAQAGTAPLAADRTSAGLLAAAARHGLAAAVVLLVARDARGGALSVDELHERELELGRAAAAALGAG